MTLNYKSYNDKTLNIITYGFYVLMYYVFQIDMAINEILKINTPFYAKKVCFTLEISTGKIHKKINKSPKISRYSINLHYTILIYYKEFYCYC